MKITEKTSVNGLNMTARQRGKIINFDDLKKGYDSLTSGQRECLKEKLEFFGQPPSEAWPEGHFEYFLMLRDGIRESFKHSHDVTVRLLITACVEAEELHKMFPLRRTSTYCRSSLIDHNKFDLIFSSQFYNEDPRLVVYRKEAQLVVDINEKLVIPSNWSMILEYLNGSEKIWPAQITKLESLINKGRINREKMMVVQKKEIVQDDFLTLVEEAKKRRTSDDIINKDEGPREIDPSLEYIIAALNVIDPPNIKTWTSCISHIRRDGWIDVPYCGITYSNFLSQFPRILHHNFFRISDVILNYHSKKDGGKIVYELRREKTSHEEMLQKSVKQKELNRINQYWEEVAEIINEFFTTVIITQERKPKPVLPLC